MAEMVPVLWLGSTGFLGEMDGMKGGHTLVQRTHGTAFFLNYLHDLQDRYEYIDSSLPTVLLIRDPARLVQVNSGHTRGCVCVCVKFPILRSTFLYFFLPPSVCLSHLLCQSVLVCLSIRLSPHRTIISYWKMFNLEGTNKHIKDIPGWRFEGGGEYSQVWQSIHPLLKQTKLYKYLGVICLACITLTEVAEKLNHEGVTSSTTHSFR